MPYEHYLLAIARDGLRWGRKAATMYSPPSGFTRVQDDAATRSALVFAQLGTG